MRDRKEIEAEKLANTIHATFAAAYALDEKVDPEWLKNVITQDRTTLREALLAELKWKRWVITPTNKEEENDIEVHNKALDEAKVIVSKLCL